MLTHALMLDLAEELFKTACDRSVMKRSEVYRQGLRAALVHEAVGTSIFEKFTFKPGDVEFDAFWAGADEGTAIWKEYTETPGNRK